MKWKQKIMRLLFALSFISIVTWKMPQNNVDAKEKRVLSTLEQRTYVKQQADVAVSYLVKDNHRLYFDLGRAEKEGVSATAIKIGMGIEQLSEDYSEGKFSATRFLRMSIPFHGNYCGPGHSGNDFTEEPIDILDEGCRRHDLCYQPFSPGANCDCNRELVEYVRENMPYMDESILWKAAAIIAWFDSVGQWGC